MNQNIQLGQQDIVKIIAVSMIFDLVQAALDFIPIIGWALNVLIDLIAWITFYRMFRKRGVKFNTTARFVAFNSGLILDLVPFINVFAWTLDVAMVIATVKREERMRMTDHIAEV